MQLAILRMKGPSAETVVPTLIERGFFVETISCEASKAGEQECTSLAPVREDALPEFVRTIAEVGGSVVSLANPSLPPVDAAEYHVDSPVISLEGGVSVYLVQLRRYERIR